ncbi:MAG: hydroxymethylglutaryl-CoA lyase [Flavisolibacter sp.]
MSADVVQLVECPRDAMQGWKTFIPTEKKIEYINSLLKVGFHTIDFGSFVSPKAIPQMADTKDVLKGLNLDNSTSHLLAIVANVRGAEEAVAFDEITFLGFPFSLSPTFQMRNTNSTPAESEKRIDEIADLCRKHHKKLVVYLSMGFGNPYGDPYNEDVLIKEAGKMVDRGIEIISLADTVGLATPQQVRFAVDTLTTAYPQTDFGVHLHSTPQNIREKLQAATEAGCRRFDGALKGIGGCPMAQDDLVGNMQTEKMIAYFSEKKILPDLNKEALQRSLELAAEIFS